MTRRPKVFNNTSTWFVMATILILCTSNKPIVTFVGYWELLIKLTIIANVSHLTQDIQRSNEVLHVTHDVRKGITYLFLVFYITLWRTSTISWCRKRNTKKTCCRKTMCLSYGFSIKDKGWYLLWHTTMDPQEMPLMQGLTCYNVNYYQKQLWFEKEEHFSFSFIFFLHLLSFTMPTTLTFHILLHVD